MSKEPVAWITRGSDGSFQVAPRLRNGLIGVTVCYALVFAAFFPHVQLWQPDRLLRWPDNPHVAEAKSWLEGKTDIPERLWDTAMVDGKILNIFPPIMTFVSVAGLLWNPEGVPFTLISALFVLPVPALAFALFLKRSGSALAATVLAVTFVVGTSEFLIISRAMQSSKVCQLNNAITQVGLLIFLLDYFGKRRFWVGGIALCIMGWARQPMWAFLLPYLWGLWDRHPKGRSRFGGLAFCGLLLAVPAVVTTVRFGHPLQTNYDKIYVDRQGDARDWLANDGSEALFGLRYVPRNLYWMNIGLPTKIEKRHGEWRWEPAVRSTGIWWTTPVLLYVFFDGRRIWRDRADRWLMPSVGAILVALMLYHNMGYSQRGYNRFSLDFLLVLLAWVAPYAMQGRRRYLTILFSLWSILYFRFIVY